MKFDEHAVLNRYNIPCGHTTYGSTAVTGRGGPFPTGDSLNQWIQQVMHTECEQLLEYSCYYFISSVGVSWWVHTRRC